MTALVAQQRSPVRAMTGQWQPKGVHRRADNPSPTPTPAPTAPPRRPTRTSAQRRAGPPACCPPSSSTSTGRCRPGAQGADSYRCWSTARACTTTAGRRPDPRGDRPRPRLLRLLSAASTGSCVICRTRSVGPFHRACGRLPRYAGEVQARGSAGFEDTNPVPHRGCSR